MYLEADHSSTQSEVSRQHITDRWSCCHKLLTGKFNPCSWYFQQRDIGGMHRLFRNATYITEVDADMFLPLFYAECSIERLAFCLSVHLTLGS